MKNQNFSWINPALKAKKDTRYGKNSKSVVAKKDIPKGEVLAVFGGYIYDLSKKENRAWIEKNGDFTLQISNRFVIGITASDKFSEAEFFNHSCDPNAGVKGQIFLTSMKKIIAGDEVTFDYAMVLKNMPGVKFYSMDCCCGKKNCRKTITEDDWKIPALQNKYKGFFNTFIQDEIDKV